MKKSIIMMATIIVMFTGCVKSLEKEGIEEAGITILKGRVVEGTNHTTLPDIKVLVTNGFQTYGSTISDIEGNFELEVDYNKIDGTYYLLLDGGSDEIRMKEELRGVSAREYDYMDIVLYSLPSFQYGGHTYQVAPDPGNEMTWDNANDYCNALTYCNLSDWRLPNKDELRQMYTARASIGGFYFDDYWSSDRTDDYYNGYGYFHDYYYLNFSSGEVYQGRNSSGVRPIRRID